MDARPPEVIDAVNGETLKLACMACIRGHRTKQCGSQACRDKVLWTIKRPGRPSNSCMCKFSGTGRCKCVIAKAQCPHKPKKGEKRAVECRCDERGRLCCTLNSDQWQAVTAGQKPALRLYRTQEELQASFSNTLISSTYPGMGPMAQGQSPFSTPQTPAASMGGFTNDSGDSTPLTPISTTHMREPSIPQSPAGPPRTRFGMMGTGAPMGGEGHIAADVLSWQGHAPIAPTPRQTYPPPATYAQPPAHSQPSLEPQVDPSLRSMPYTFDNSVTSPPAFSPHHQAAYPHTHPASPLYQPVQARSPGQNMFSTIPPVTASLSELSMASSGALPAPSAFDVDYFNFQFPGAICQQCGMADCTCRSCPTVLQSTMDGSWQQCCSRKHVHAGPATVVAQAGHAAKSCCGSKAKSEPSIDARSITTLTGEDRNAGGCCSGSSSQQAFVSDPFDFGMDAQVNGQNHFPMHGLDAAASEPHMPSFTDPSLDGNFTFDDGLPTAHTNPPGMAQPSHTHTHPSVVGEHGPGDALDFKQDPVPEWQNPNDIDMDFDEFLQEAGCGCGTDCPCGMDGNVDMDVDFDLEVGSSPVDTATPPKGSCCGGGGG